MTSKSENKAKGKKKDSNYYKSALLDPAQRLANAIIDAKKNGVNPR